MSKLSVVIVNYNAGPVLHEAVNAILRSASVARIIVVDNNSEDDSMQTVENIADPQSRLVFIRNNANVGFAGACNRGMALADNPDYLLFLNPDCIMEPDALEILLACLEGFPQAAVAGPLLLNSDGSEQAGGRRAVPTPWRSFVRAFGLSRMKDRYPKLFSDFLLHKDPLPDAPMEVEAISGSCMLIRQAAIADVGNMDEGYFLHCEDLDWCMRFRQQGWKVIFVPDARVVHHQGSCSAGRPVFVEWHKHKGMMYFYDKFFRHQYPGPLRWIVGVGVWLRFGFVAVYYSAQHVRQWLKQ
ncbi:MAG: glycosyltransferase family 2 protein [Deltaproteobacteria bacterium]|nr:glycosyltransferase family 2 protein [Deltaproteobacteria bacterium]